MRTRPDSATCSSTPSLPRAASRLALLGLLACLGSAAQAQALVVGARTGASVRSLLGVNVGPGPQGDTGNVDLTAAYQQRGVNLVRNHDYYGPLDMATMYPDRSKDPMQSSSYNFTGVLDTRYGRSSDSVFASIVNGGFEPYFRIGDSYNNVSPPNSAQLPNWSQAAVQVLKHYRSGQWSGFNSNFRFVEIGNEPDNQIFWPSPLTSNDFNQLYDQTARAVRSAFPSLKIGGPGWAPSGCLAPEGQAKVRSLLDYVKAANSPLDFMSFHVYGTDATTYQTCAQFYRTELDNRGLNGVELHITEWNTPNGSAGSTTGQLRYNAQGAAYMTAAWIKLQGAGVAESTFYRGSDPAPNSPEFYGIFYGDGRPKKVAEAFSLWRDFTAYEHVLQSSGGPAGTTWLVAESAAGARAMLIANPSTSSVSSSISFADGKTLDDYQVSTSTVSDGVVIEPLTGSTVSVPAKSTVLLRLTPRLQAFAATAAPSGTLSALTLALNASVAAVDVGKPGLIYILALAGSNWFVFNGTSWSLWSAGDVAGAFVGNLPPNYAVTPISGFDARGLSGVQFFVAYGTSLAEMLGSARFKMVYQVP